MGNEKYIFWIVLLLCSLSVEALTTIGKVRYEGNEVTQVSVLNREVYVKEGDELDNALLEKSRQAIMDLDLFKSVKLYLQYNDKDSPVINQQVDVVFVVDEKYYLLIYPKAKVNDDEVHLGLQLRWDNVLGLNHEMRFLVENRGETQNVTEKRNSFRYFYPNINNSAYNLDLKIQDANNVDETDGVIDRQDSVYRIVLSRWLNEAGRNHGWFAGVSASYQQRFNRVISGSQASENINAIILDLDSGFINVNEYEYNRGGKAFGYKLDWAHDSIGSDAMFTKHQFYYKSYYRFDDLPYSNLNVQAQFGHANNDILGSTAFSLGSSNDLRGYENNRFIGNTMFLVNMEYMFPHPAYPIVRYVYFLDIGNAYDSIEKVLHTPLNVGAGIGMRWKIKSFVRLNIRIDLGYGFADDEYRFTLGTKHAF